MNKKILVLGGGTFNHVRAHLSLATPAFGQTARRLAELCRERFDKMDVELFLTKMADPTGPTNYLVTNDDVEKLIDVIVASNAIKVVFFNIALCDYEGQIGEVESFKYATRLSTSEGDVDMKLTVAPKLIKRIREKRKDIFLVGFKTTSNATPEEQYKLGLNLLKKASCNLVMVNDISTRENFIITPEEGVYRKDSRDELLKELVDMTFWRTHLSFTRSTVVDGKPVPWNDERVYPTLREVVNHCISEGAYKKFNGVTTGHFAAKIGPGQFLTSIRKTNFNEMEKVGLVEVRTDGDDAVISYGAKPSVGGQSQRIIFGMYPDADCIVHFHCPLKTKDMLGKPCVSCKEGTYYESSIFDDWEGVLHCNKCGDGTKRHRQPSVPVVSQREYECGSHECGQNTANGLADVGNGIYAVMLDKHGPNIVFHHSVDPKKVIDFIEANFDLDRSTSGFEQVYLGA